MASTAMTLRDRAARADQIVAARARGAEWEDIAGRHGISARQAQRIYAAGSARSPALERDPLDLACEVLAEYDAAVEELRALASTTSHDGTRLGSIRARIDVIAVR